MKKSISVLLAILLTMATILSGCGGGNSSATSPSGTGASTDDSSEQELLPDMRVLIDALEAAFCDYTGSTPYFEEKQFGDEWFVYIYPEEGGETIETYHIDARGKITDFTEETVTLDDFHVRDEVLAKLRDSNPTSEEETVEPNETAANSDLEWKTVRWRITDRDGYKVVCTFTYSPFMLYDDDSQLVEYWDSLGGSDVFPSKEELYSPSTDSSFKDIYCMVGTIQASNVTEGWDFSSENPYDNRIGLYFEHPKYSLTKDTPIFVTTSWVYYSNGAYGQENEETVQASIHMTRNDWGPVPIIVTLKECFSPNYPQGQFREMYEQECYFSAAPFGYECEFETNGNFEEGYGEIPIEIID